MSTATFRSKTNFMKSVGSHFYPLFLQYHITISHLPRIDIYSGDLDLLLRYGAIIVCYHLHCNSIAYAHILCSSLSLLYTQHYRIATVLNYMHFINNQYPATLQRLMNHLQTHPTTRHPWQIRQS